MCIFQSFWFLFLTFSLLLPWFYPISNLMIFFSSSCMWMRVTTCFQSLNSFVMLVQNTRYKVYIGRSPSRKPRGSKELRFLLFADLFWPRLPSRPGRWKGRKISSTFFLAPESGFSGPWYTITVWWWQQFMDLNWDWKWTMDWTFVYLLRFPKDHMSCGFCFSFGKRPVLTKS